VHASGTLLIPTSSNVIKALLSLGGVCDKAKRGKVPEGEHVDLDSSLVAKKMVVEVAN